MTPSLLQARDLLNQFACNERPAISEEDCTAVKSALRELVSASDFLTLGVCADSCTQGYKALTAYVEALGVGAEALTWKSTIEGPTYIKYNTQTGKHYTSDYPGNARGVLVCCHTYDPELTSDMYGHFPLNLFGEPN